MLPINRLYFQIKTYSSKHKPLYLFSLTLFFYAVFDGIFSFIFPLTIERSGFSKTMIGIVIGSSSIAGGIFDFIISKYIRSTHFRRIYLLMFVICFLVPAVLWTAKPLWVFLLASGLWGVYYDLYNFGRFDFVSRMADKDEYSGSFGLLRIFTSLGYMIAPILAGLTIGSFIDKGPYLLMYIAIIISLLFFISLIYLSGKKKEQYYTNEIHKPINFFKEIGIWKKIGKLLLPLLLLTMLLNVFDAFFWTIGPLLSESFRQLHPFNGLFLAIYELPPLLVGWFIGNITIKFGKKHTAFQAFIIGSLLISLLPLTQNLTMILLITFLSSLCIAIAWPAMNAAYADYICEARVREGEIEALDDFFTNLGYVVGPITAGFLADRLGNQNSFMFLGLAGAIIAFILWRKTPKKINIRA